MPVSAGHFQVFQSRRNQSQVQRRLGVQRFGRIGDGISDIIRTAEGWIAGIDGRTEARRPRALLPSRALVVVKRSHGKGEKLVEQVALKLQFFGKDLEMVAREARRRCIQIGDRRSVTRQGYHARGRIFSGIAIVKLEDRSVAVDAIGRLETLIAHDITQRQFVVQVQRRCVGDPPGLCILERVATVRRLPGSPRICLRNCGPVDVA